MTIDSIDLCCVSYNTRPLIERLITTLHEPYDNQRPWKLLFADNGSTDGSREYLEDLFASSDYIDYLALNENIGYAAACNHLAAQGNSDIICLLNGDVWLTGQDVGRAIEFFEMRPDVAIMGPKQRDENHRIRHAGIVGTHTAPKHRGWCEYDPHNTLYRDVIECVTVSGSAYFIRRSVWRELTECSIYRAGADFVGNTPGAFLPTRHYYEETFLSYHAAAHQYKVYFNGLISIGHSWHAASPIGGHADREFSSSRSIFRAACALHGIECD